MKRLFVARHGDNRQNRLTESGIQQMQKMGKCIENIMGAWRCEIVSSPALWTVESSLILADCLHLSSITTDDYLTKSRFGEECLEIIESLDRRNKERRLDPFLHGLIIVTHAELAEGIPKYFAKKESIQYDFNLELKKGAATYIDIERKTALRIP